MIDGPFDWDPRKALTNEQKHGVSFDEAVTAFYDDFLRSVHDAEHSTVEDRFMIVGYSRRGRLVTVWFTYRDAVIRLIGARLATAAERRRYEETRRD